MKGIPLPANLPWEIQLLFWILLLLIGVFLGIATWFLLRHITQQDNQFKEVRDGLSKQKGEFEGIKNQVVEATSRIMLESQAIRKSALDFQTQVGNEIITIKKEMLNIENSLDRTKAKAEELEGKIDKTSKGVDTINEGMKKISAEVEHHQKTMSVGAKIFKLHKEEITGIKTTIKKLSEGRLLVGEKRVPKPGKDDASEPG